MKRARRKQRPIMAPLLPQKTQTYGSHQALRHSKAPRRVNNVKRLGNLPRLKIRGAVPSNKGLILLLSLEQQRKPKRGVSHHGQPESRSLPWREFTSKQSETRR